MKATEQPTLIIMAAGMGSRYGGLKQVDKITDAGEIILDFSLYDAMMAGFNRAIFVIKEENREIFREMVDERAGRFMEIEYAYQKLEDIPEGFAVPEERQKPWGTAHAVLACRELINGPFVVINADDYYGPDAFVQIYDYLTTHKDDDVYEYCMVGYQLKNTVTENGHVARGVCELDDKGFLKKVTERTKIMHHDDGIAYTEDDGESWGYLNGNALWVEWEMVCDGATINLKVNARGDYRPAWKALKVSLPAGEKRTLRVNGVEGGEWVV